MKKHTTILLLTAILLSQMAFFSACGTTEEPIESTEQATETASETTVTDTLPQLDLAGGTYTLLVNESEVDYYDVPELTGDVVDDAIYNARLSVNSRLNCDLQYLTGPGSTEWANRQQTWDFVQAVVMAGSSDFDAVDNQSYNGMYLMNGLLLDMSQMEYIDVDNPWWDKSITESMAIGGKYPFLAGAYSLDRTAGTFCFYFNEEIATNLALPDLYQLVYDGDWTVDKVAEFSEMAYVDTNGNSKVDEEDQLGVVFEGGNYFTGFFEACGVHALKTVEDKFVFDFGNARNVDVVEKVGSFVKNTTGVYNHGGDDQTYRGTDALFLDGNVLFTGGWFKCAESYRDLDFSWGILPYPKLYAEDEYTGGVLTIYGLLSMPKSCRDIDGTSAMLECLCYEYYANVVPAYYEVAMKVKYASGSQMADMLDFITGNIVYDTGLALAGALDYTIDGTFKDAVRNNGNWASKMASLESKISALIEKLNEAYADLG